MVNDKINKSYSRVLLDNIEYEKKCEMYSASDRLILEELLYEINEYAGTDFHYIAELHAFNIKGSGVIVAKYVERFESLHIKALLLPQVVLDKVPKAAELTLKSYLEFKSSDEYISPPDTASPVHIFVQYDNMLIKLKPKRIKRSLYELVKNPRDAVYLPFTTEMLASWNMLEMKELGFKYFKGEGIVAESVGLPPDNSERYYPSLEDIRRDLRFIGIGCLGYFAEQEVLDFLYAHIDDPDKDIQLSIKKNIKKIEKKLAKM